MAMETVQQHTAWKWRDVNYFLMYQFFAHLEFYNGLFVLYLSHQGLLDGQINLVIAASIFTRVAMEIPSGYLGDRFGDKPLLLCGIFLIAVYAFGMIFATTFWAILVLFIAHGLSIASLSGAEDSFFYRTVLQGDNNAVARVRAISASLNYAALGIAAILGGCLVELFGWTSLYSGYLVCIGIAFLSLQRIKATSIATKDVGHQTVHMRKMANMVPQQKRLLCIIVLFAIIEACANVFFVYAQFRFQTFTSSIAKVGLAMGAVEIASALGAFASQQFHLHSRKFQVAIVLLAVCLLASLMQATVCFMLAFFAFIFFATVFKVICENHIVMVVPVTLTATMLSIFSFSIAVFTGVLHLIIGLVGKTQASNPVLYILVTITIMASGVLGAMSGHQRTIVNN